MMMKVVQVTWVDATLTAYWRRIDQMHPLITLVTTGILCREDADSISVALDYDPKDGDYKEIKHIPRVAIVSITEFTETTKTLVEQGKDGLSWRAKEVR